MKQYKVKRVFCPFDENSVSIRSVDFRAFEKPATPAHWSFDERMRSAKSRQPRAARSGFRGHTVEQALAALANAAAMPSR